MLVLTAFFIHREMIRFIKVEVMRIKGSENGSSESSETAPLHSYYSALLSLRNDIDIGREGD